jgi:hypothetical protein
MIYDAKSEAEILEAIKGLELVHGRDIKFEIRELQTEETDVYAYTWDIMAMFGARFGYTADEFHIIAQQRLENLMPFFNHKLYKKNGDSIEIQKTVEMMTDEERISLCNEMIKYAFEKFAEFKLPPYQEWLDNNQKYRNMSEKYNLMIRTFR